MIGVAGADLYVNDIELTLLPFVRSIGELATILNASGRVVVSTDPHRPTGSVYRQAHEAGIPAARPVSSCCWVSMDPRSAFDAYTARLVAAVGGHADVLGLVLLGSGAEPERIDQWSDHDFFLIVSGDRRPGAVTSRGCRTPAQIAVRAKEGVHGQKIVYADGHVLEFAVATPDEMLGWAVTAYRVVLDRGGIEALLSEPRYRRRRTRPTRARVPAVPVDPLHRRRPRPARRGARGRPLHPRVCRRALLAAWRVLLPPQVGERGHAGCAPPVRAGVPRHPPSSRRRWRSVPSRRAGTAADRGAAPRGLWATGRRPACRRSASA